MKLPLAPNGKICRVAPPSQVQEQPANQLGLWRYIGLYPPPVASHNYCHNYWSDINFRMMDQILFVVEIPMAVTLIIKLTITVAASKAKKNKARQSRAEQSCNPITAHQMFS
jgi:hypothetical protein